MTNPKKPPKIHPPEPKPDGPPLWTHALMPGDGEKPAPRVLRFFVTRKNDKTGAWDYAPQTFGEHDLPDMAALFEAYGGGLYWIRGQDHTGFVGPFGVWPLAGKPKPLAPEPEPAPPAPGAGAMPPTGPGGFDMGAMFMMLMQNQLQAQQQAQAENTKLLGTIITAVLTPRGEGLPEKLLTALVTKGSPTESGEIMRQTMGAWKEGLGQGTELAKIAAEAAAAGTAPAEPSGLDKAMDAAAPAVLGKMVDKIMGS